MSILVLVIVVAVGITGIVVAVHATGGTTTVRLANGDAAIKRFHEDFEAEAIKAVVLSSDHETAFLWLENNRIGIVHAIGDRYLTRIVEAKDIRGIELTGESSLVLGLRDMTWRGGTFVFDDADTAEKVYQAMGGTA